MKRLSPWGILGVLWFARKAEAQTEAFTRQVACPTNPSIMGYTTLQDLNNDMADELTRIEDIGEAPDMDYILNLCSDPDNVFDATGNNPIRPVIDRVQIFCGGPGAEDTTCFIDASREQLVVEDISTTLGGYELNEVLFQGLTFTRFGRGLSASLVATAATATFIDCTWEDFDNNDFVINVAGGNSMRLVLMNALIRSSSGDPNDATAEQAFINNVGGVVEVEGIRVVDAFPEFAVFNNVENGQITVSMATIDRSVLAQSFVRMDSGVVTFNSVTISNSLALDNVFFIRGTRAEAILSGLNMVNNVVDRIWNGVNISQGASLFMSGSTFRGNTNMLFGVSVQTLPNFASNAVIQDTTFDGNVGSGVAFGLQSALINVLGNNDDQPFADILRVDFEGNSNFVSNINALQGGEFRLVQACFIGNSNTNVVNAGPGSEGSTGELNFVGDSEVSTNCETNPDRFFINTQGCATLSDADVCLSQIVFTEGPSDTPTQSPTAATESPSSLPTPSPSDIPSSIPTSTPTAAPTLSMSPSSSLFPTTSLSPTSLAGEFPSGSPTESPVINIPAPILPPISRPTFRRDCDRFRHQNGKGRDIGCGKRRKKSKSMEKLTFTRKSHKSSKKSKKSSKKGQKKESSKKAKGDRNYWQPLGGANGAYRDRTFQTGSFSGAWSGADLRGWDFTGILDPHGGGGHRFLLSNATKH